jgi:hypothetical protein
MKLTSLFFCIVVILSSCSDTPDAVRTDISITADGKFYEKAQLIRSVRIENTSYQLYENQSQLSPLFFMVCFILPLLPASL